MNISYGEHEEFLHKFEELYGDYDRLLNNYMKGKIYFAQIAGHDSFLSKHHIHYPPRLLRNICRLYSERLGEIPEDIFCEEAYCGRDQWKTLLMG